MKMTYRRIGIGVLAGNCLICFIFLLSLFFLQSGIRAVMIKMAAPVPDSHNFIVGVIQGDGKSPALRQISVDVEPKALYVMQTEVFGEPEIHMDIMRPEVAMIMQNKRWSFPLEPKMANMPYYSIPAMRHPTPSCFVCIFWMIVQLSSRT